MKIAVAADHAGYPLKQVIVSDLRAAGHDITDLGTHDPHQPDDYPDFARLASNTFCWSISRCLLSTRI